MHVFKALLATALGVFTATSALALPIGFGRNQADLEYHELNGENFHIYHDERSPAEARMMLHALEAIRPHMEKWFDKQREKPLPVVMSAVNAVNAGASFGNFLTDAIELQTGAQGTRDLVWHEYVHSTMYRHLDNWFGPAGAILHLPWMPAWYIEGLAEALSVSVGSDVQAGIERYQALSGNWPTYDRLHSLYGKYGFFLRGYATSGGFVAYLFRKGEANRLPQMLSDFYYNSMPWWWPWAAVPFNGWMPMDSALEDLYKAQGEALYEEYKRAATAHWQNVASGRRLWGEKGARTLFTSSTGLAAHGKRTLMLVRIDGDTWETELLFDAKTGWAVGYKKTARLPDHLGTYHWVANPGERAVVTYDINTLGDKRSTIMTEGSDGEYQDQVHRNPNISDVFTTAKGTMWLEQDFEQTRLCYRADGKLSCPVAARMPQTLTVIGHRQKSAGKNKTITDRIWLRRSLQTLQGDRHVIVAFDPQTGRTMQLKTSHLGKPLRLVHAGTELWMLSGERTTRLLRKIDSNGRCLAQAEFQDHLVELNGTADGHLVLTGWAGASRYIRRLSAKAIKTTTCTTGSPYSSPMLAAMRSPTTVKDLATAAGRADLWQEPSKQDSDRTSAALAAATALGESTPSTQITAESEPYSWGARPVLFFPWIGAEDARGNQLGMLSIPLMDYLQNETVRLTLLYGIESRFPYSELMLTSTRFRPTLSFALFRQQTWNSLWYKSATKEYVSAYYDEKGASVGASWRLLFRSATLTLDTTFKHSHLKPYIGPMRARQGNVNEAGAGMVWLAAAGDFTFSYSLTGRSAPEFMNKELWDYNQLGTGLSLSYGLPFWHSTFITGIEGSRTRGPRAKRRALQEVYRPLKTFVPGSGGGYNKNSFPIVGAGGLFGAQFGDTQARAKANWVVPLVRDLDKLFWILYFERLDFTAFYNYGGAWVGDKPRDIKNLTRAHGYNVDLNLDNKGVRFNIGLGTGQVVGQDFQVYMTSGFDALF